MTDPTPDLPAEPPAEEAPQIPELPRFAEGGIVPAADGPLVTDDLTHDYLAHTERGNYEQALADYVPITEASTETSEE